jgi:hypothetical protein
MEEVKKSLETQTETQTTEEHEEKPAETQQPEEHEDKPEDKPAEQPPVEPPAPKKDEIGDELENTNSVIRNRLKKQAEKYDRELADRDAKYYALAKQFEEFKQGMKKNEPPKTRENFGTDEEYVAYLTRQQIDADRAEQDRARKEQEEKAAQERAEQDKAEQAVRERQERFVNNINYCFDQPEQKAEFMGKVKTYLGKGLGDLLDACPVASDYLLASPRGPKVLDRLLTDVNAFKRVFDPRGITPMDQYYELRELEREIYGKPAPAATEPPPVEPKPTEEPKPAKQVPKYGKPGAQGGGRSADVYTDPKARRDEVRRLMGF